MGKKNLKKRRQAEVQESILPKRFNKKQLENLKQFGTLESEPLPNHITDQLKKQQSKEVAQTDEAEAEAGGMEFVFGEDNQIISTNQTNFQLSGGEDREGEEAKLKNIRLVQNEPKGQSSFQSLLHNLKRNKKCSKIEVPIEKEIIKVIEMGQEKFQVQVKEGEVEDEFAEKGSQEETDTLNEGGESSDEETEKDTTSLFVDTFNLNFEDKAYALQLSQLIQKAKVNQFTITTLQNNTPREGEEEKPQREQNFITVFDTLNPMESMAQLKSVVENTQPISLHQFPLKKPIQTKLTKNKWTLDREMQQVLGCMLTYKDLMYPNQPMDGSPHLKRVSCIHLVNHVLKNRDRILKNNHKLSQRTQLQKLDLNLPDLELKDSGFTRPKVLILTPFKSQALTWVHTLIQSGTWDQVENLNRFNQSFSIQGTDKLQQSDKPYDHKLTFQGNSDDCFRVGISLAKHRLKLFTPFYQSDVVVASPLGLRLATKELEDPQFDADFLSSLEILLVDRFDHIAMQNLDHLEFVLSLLNQTPKKDHHIDFQRVKSWALDGLSPYFRQTIIFSHLVLPELNQTLRTLTNFRGKIQFPYRLPPPILQSQTRRTTHNFSRVPITHLTHFNRDKLEYFQQQLPQLKTQLQFSKVLLVVNDHLDFVQLRNLLTQEQIPFLKSSEYSHTHTLISNRDSFHRHPHSSHHNLWLLTERCHFYRRYKLQGSYQTWFYSLPKFPHLYPEFLSSNYLKDQEKDSYPKCQVHILFTIYDKLTLDLLVGKTLATTLCNNSKTIHKLNT